MRKWLLFFLLVFNSSVALARPKIGLVLSGGGAKGAAHIGVLKIIEDNHIPIDYVVGTSIGSYVGGLYAMGYSASEIEQIMLNTNFDKGYSDQIPREQLQFEDKRLRDHYNLTFHLGYSDGTFKMPSGLLLGQSALQVLKSSVGEIGELKSFDDLPIPYRAVATDIATAKPFVLSKGSLSQAIKASSTVPGALEPLEIDGHLLVDGGIVNNMPVNVAKEMGADIVIAVDIGSSLLEQEQIKNTVDVLNQLSTILTTNTTTEQKSFLNEKDILIRPEIDEIPTTDFSRLNDALVLGEQAALTNLHNLKSLSIEPTDYQSYVTHKQQLKAQWQAKIKRPVIEVRFDNQSHVNNSYIADHFDIQVGDEVDKQQVEQATQAVYALDHFDFVNTEFIDETDGRIIVLTTKAKSWGPNYLLFGFSWQGDMSGESMLSVDFAYRQTDVTTQNGSLLYEFTLGWEPLAGVEFYQPIDDSYDSYLRIRAQYKEEKLAESKDIQTTLSANKYRPEFHDKSILAKLGLGYHFAYNGISEIGVIAQRGDLSFEDDTIDNAGYYSYGSYLLLGYDDLNSINFPTSGNKLTLTFIARNDNYMQPLKGEDEDNNLQALFDWRGAFSIQNHAFVGIASASTLFNDSDFSIRWTELGGFLNLSGLQNDTLIGVHKVFGAAVYQYDIGRDVPGGTGLPIYIGGSLEAGKVWGLEESVSATDLITSTSLYLGTDTSFGPAVIGLGYAQDFEGEIDEQLRVFFSIGKNW